MEDRHKFCENFEGGYCPHIGMNIQPKIASLFCGTRCQRDPEAYNARPSEPIKPAKQPTKQQVAEMRRSKKREKRAKPTVPEMAKSFSKAMARWAKKGFETVSEEEYIRRRAVCADCAGGWRCPYCGCMIWAKTALATEKCPDDKWDPLKTHPMKHAEVFKHADKSYVDIIDLFRGQSVFIIANGPSFNAIDRAKLKQPGIVTFGMNNGAHSFRPNLWCAQDDPTKFMDSLWEDPAIMKFTMFSHAKKKYWKVAEKRMSDRTCGEMPNI